MKQFLQKSQAALHKPSPPQTDEPSTITPPTLLDILRYRYHHGTNLGSIFVLEKWLFPSMFPSSSKGDSEFDAVTASISSLGLPATKEKWENHWLGALSDDELRWLVNDARCTSIRLPIGYFTLGSEWCVDTPFEKVREVYENAWRVLEGLVRRCRAVGIGVLLDFHSVHGGANGEAHSGTSKGKAGLWGNKMELERARKALGEIAKRCRELDGVIGIQVVNEAVWDARGMYEWYESVIEEIGRWDASIPIYVSDGWDLGRALKWVNGRKVFGGGTRNPVVVDTHKYYTFSQKDRSKAPMQIIESIPGELGELKGKDGSLVDRGEAQVIVGEYSCVLDGQTWRRVPGGEKEGLVKKFGLAQTQKWQQKAGGAYFWTMKMDWMDGGEWGFVEQAKKGNIVPPPWLLIEADEVGRRIQQAVEKRGELASGAKASHVGYWYRTAPGKEFRHELYTEGWEVGFSDALKFFGGRTQSSIGLRSVGADKIGCLEIWVKKRLLESGRRGEFVWEWEQGFRKGAGDFYGVVGI